METMVLAEVDMVVGQTTDLEIGQTVEAVEGVVDMKRCIKVRGSC